METRRAPFGRGQELQNSKGDEGDDGLEAVRMGYGCGCGVAFKDWLCTKRPFAEMNMCDFPLLVLKQKMETQKTPTRVSRESITTGCCIFVQGA